MRPDEQPIRVAMLGSMPPQRGISTYCLELAASLGDQVQLEVLGFRQMYPAWLYPGGEPPLDATFPEPPSANIRIRARLTWYNPFTWIGEGLVPAADLLHVQFWSLPLLPLTLTVMLLFRLRGKPVVLTVHNVSSREYDSLYQTGLALLLRLANSVVVHTMAQAKQLVRRHRWSRNKVRRIPHGVLRMYRDTSLDAATARRTLGLSQEGRVVLFFGAIRPYKGLDILLQAFSEVVRVLPDATLLIAGKSWGPWLPQQRLIQRYALESRVVTRLEYIPTDQVKMYFAAADLAVFPYRESSAQSGAALAAIGCHLPLVASDVGGLEELLLDRKFLVPPGNVTKLAQAVIAALHDEQVLARLRRDSMSVARDLSWNEIAAQLVTLYCSLLRPVRHSKTSASVHPVETTKSEPLLSRSTAGDSRVP